ncbi:MAG TPA: ABC transporter permease [Gemmatimonadaceae bacterium]|nr:ABC transporter permease [Gemmatimonadaceae bacterium]
MRQLLRSGARLFWRRSVDDEVDDELTEHIEMLVRRLELEGLSPEAAREAAARRFGDLTMVRNECRTLAHDVEEQMIRQDFWQQLRQDVAYGTRTLRRAPLYTIIAVLTLAIGIGASASIFSVVHAVLLRALPYRDADRVVAVWNAYRQGGTVSHTAIAPAEFADVMDQNRSFDAVAAISRGAANLTGSCGGSASCEPERANGYTVSPSLFTVLGTAPALGRAFTESDGAAGAEPVALLSHSVWRRRFGGDSAVIGRGITVNGRLRTIVGVMPAEVRFPDAPIGFLRDRGDIWMPNAWQNNRGEERGNQYLGFLARMRPGTSMTEVRTDLETISTRFRAAFPDRYDPSTVSWALDAIPLREQMVGDVRRPLLIVMGAVVLLMLIACANVAHLSLARGAARRQEFAVRTALGAGRMRLVRQLLTESLMLGAMSGVLGIAIAVGSTRVLVRLDPGMIPQLDATRVNGIVLVFALLATLFCALLVGVVPALRQSMVSVHDAIRAGRGAAAQPRRRVRSVLVVAEVAMALVILVGAGLLTRSFLALQKVDQGFSTGPALTFAVTLPRARYDSAARMIAFHDRLQSELASIPGVEAVSAIDPLPLGGTSWSGTFHVEGQPTARGAEAPHGEYNVALPGFIDALQLRLVTGRDFEVTDGPGAPAVAIVDESLAAQYWPGEDPLGKRISSNGDSGPWVTVIGVVRHVHRSGPKNAGEPQIYFAYRQRVQTPLSYVLRTTVDPLSIVGAVRSQVASLDRDLPVARVASMATLESAALARDRFNALIFLVFAGTALLLAAIGLYGVMAYLVAQRQAELGLRLALGGGPGDVARLVIGDGMRMALLGIVLGTVASLALGRALDQLLYGTKPTDPVTYAVIAATLALVALLASAIPALRAMKADPVDALRA